MKLLVAADLHLEKGRDYSEDRLGEQEAVWAEAIRLGLEADVDGFLFAGDATEYRAPSSAARAAFQRPLIGLAQPVLAIPGNHDVRHPRYPTALDLMAPAYGGRLLTVESQPGLFEHAGMVIATLPWTPLGTLVASRNGATREALWETAANGLLHIAEMLREEAEKTFPGQPVLLLGHWALDEASTPSGLSAALFGEPVLPLDDLQRLMFAGVAMGHVHRPERWSEVISIGSPMPLDFGEAACAHGCWLFDTDEGWEFLRIESRPFKTIDLTADAAQCFTDGTMHWGGNEVADAVVRVRYTATEEQARRINDAEIRRSLLAAGAHRVWQIVPTIERAERARVADINMLHPFAAIDAWLDARGLDDDGVRERARDVYREAAE